MLLIRLRGGGADLVLSLKFAVAPLAGSLDSLDILDLLPDLPENVLNLRGPAQPWPGSP